MTEHDRTASLMSPGKLSRLKPQPAATPEAWLDRTFACRLPKPGKPLESTPPTG